MVAVVDMAAEVALETKGGINPPSQLFNSTQCR